MEQHLALIADICFNHGIGFEPDDENNNNDNHNNDNENNDNIINIENILINNNNKNNNYNSERRLKLPRLSSSNNDDDNNILDTVLNNNSSNNNDNDSLSVLFRKTLKQRELNRLKKNVEEVERVQENVVMALQEKREEVRRVISQLQK